MNDETSKPSRDRDDAERQELKRLDLMRAVCSSHRTEGSPPLPQPDPPQQRSVDRTSDPAPERE